jgi:hypothetical protein
MPIRPIPDPVPGERLLAVAPRPEAGQVTGWRRRVNGFSGRALAADALTREQQHRAGHLALLAQALSPGVVEGLAVARNASGDTIHITAGQGLSAQGEDLRLSQPLSVRLADVQVFESAAESDTVSGDALLTRRLGRSLGELIAAGADLPRAQILLLVPATVDTAAAGDPGTPCARDPADDAFLDLRRIDAARLALYPWPTDMLALPTPGLRWRNRLARALFMAEKDLAPDQLTPWQAVGVPIALIGFSDTWQALFADSHAVTRPGGRPKRRNALINDAGHPYLWEARMRQFADHLADTLAASPDIVAAAREFKHLPPAGLLPRAAVDFARDTQGFLPVTWTVDAVPVPMEQLDMILAEAATLADFNTDLTDRAQILVPVPQTVYEPDLLVTASIDAEFGSTRDAFLARRAEVLARRGVVRGRVSALARATDGKPPVFPDPDPGALEVEDVSTLPLDPLEADYGTVTDATGAVTVPALVALAARLDADPVKASVVRAGQTLKLVDLGIVAYIAELQRQTEAADDKVAFGYERARLDIHKIRTLAAGGERINADQVGISTALGALVKADSAQVSAQAFDALKVKLDARAYTEPAGVLRGSAAVTPATRATTSAFASSATANTVSLEALRVSPLTGFSNSTTLLRDSAFINAEGIQPAVFSGSVIDVSVPPFSIDSQLATPPAVETRGQAIGGRYDAVSAIADLDLNLGGIGFFGIGDAATNNQPLDLETLKTRKDSVLNDVRGEKFDPIADNNKTEGAYLSRALLTIDETLATWRQVASRVAQYRAAIADCQTTLAAIRTDARTAAARLAEIDADLAEARHDVAVTRALIAEEEARIAELNAQRARILADEVPFLAFRRPRVALVLDELPERALDPAFTVDPVPACRDANLAPPPELEAMLGVLRQAPVAWFPAVARALDGVGRFDHLLQLVDFSRVRALASTPMTLAVSTAAAPRAVAVLAASQTRISLARRTSATTTLRPLISTLVAPQWRDLRNDAAVTSSLADLIEAGGKGGATAAQGLIDALGDVGACLYRGFSATPARLRLSWAETLSEHDAAVELANLARLPGFAGIDFTLRRTLQTFVDALYARIDPANNDARALMSDLVRVCLLAAAHAPVKRIVAARVQRDTPARPGSRVPLTVDPSLVRVGMKVHFYADSRVVAEGVLDDIGVGAAARVIKTYGTQTQFAANAVAQLID